MALGILEPRAESVPGTVQVKQQSDVETSSPQTTILVPQPTDDPNDPLVLLFGDVLIRSLLTFAELATLATRHYPRHPLSRISRRHHCFTIAGRGFSRARNQVQAHLRGCSFAYRISFGRCRSGQLAVRTTCKSLGKATCLPPRLIAHDSFFSLGRIDPCWLQL